MSNFTFLPTTPTDSSICTTLDDHHQKFHDLSEFIYNDQDYYINSSYQPSHIINQVMPDQTISAAENPVRGDNQLPWSRSDHLQEDTATTVRSRIAFRTQSTLDVLDDGFKWRKYGKKKIKNSPNPRNYYKCLSGGCYVKKRVERDGGDPRFVITTYEGIHNHT